MIALRENLKLATKPYVTTNARLADGADTPRDFLERCLADLTALEPKIGAFVHLNVEGARAAADQSTKRWRQGRQRSPIDGMPLGIKDIIETVDMPTENGSPLFAGWRSERDGASVAALREAGAVILGKTVTTEFAAGEPPDTLDKDFIRRWVAARCDPYKDQIPEIPPDVILEAAARYVNLYEQLTGQELELPEATVLPLTRIRANLKKYFEMAA
jgi:Amidase